MKKIANYLIALAVAAFTFTSCEDVPSPFGTVVQPDSGDEVVIEPQGSGTQSDPYNVAAALEFVSGLGADVPSDKEIYIKGIVSEVQDVDVSGIYGNATYNISDDAEGKANKFMIYRGYGLGGKKFNEGATPVKAGDNVVIKSKVVNYKGNTPETVQNSCIIVDLNGTKDEGGGSDTPTSDLGTKDAPITVAKALETINKLADGGETGEAYVKGIISKVQSYSDQYKSITYYISDDGKEANELQIYSGKNVGGADFTSKDELSASDVVVVKGKLKKFVNTKTGAITLEMNQPNEIITITKGSGGGGGGGETPSATMTKSVAGTVVTFTSSSITGSDEVTVDFNAQGWEDKAAPTTVTLSNGTTIEFGGGENTSNSPVFYTATKGVRVYAKNTITVKGSKSIAKIVMNCDSYNGTDYVGNEMLYAKEEGKTVTICNDHTEAKGGTQVRVQTMVITFEGEGSGGGSDTPTPSGNTGLEANFASGEGDFTIDNKDIGSLSYVWKADSKGYMKASAFVSNANNAAESWLVSPAFSLKGISAPVMTFNNACNYVKDGTITDHIKVMVYDGAKWSEATIANMPDGKSWTFVDSTVDLKAVAGKDGVKVAFKYVSTTAVAPTWEIKNVSIK